jgi:cytochrome P450
MGREIPSLTLRDDLLFNLGYVVPMVLQGTFTRSRFWVSFWDRVHRDAAGVRFGERLRGRYPGGLVWLHLGTSRALLVLEPEAIRQVLEHSPAVYADGAPKRQGMRIFQPNAVTISRGEDWRDRRQFNEAVLEFGRPVHRYAESILSIVRDEVDRAGGLESWDDFDDLFARITRQVIFGRSVRDDRTLTDLLHRMLREANRPIKPRKSRYFEPFYARIRGYLDTPEPGSLVALCRQTPATARTRVENQIPHWMFAMWETLASNTVRALAVILSHPEAEARVREELAGANLASPDGIAQLEYLGSCLQEAMRLWPTTPMLVRESVAPDRLVGAAIPVGSQVLIWNSFNHRDRTAYPAADKFRPEAWADGRPSTLFNHLSSGPQICAGIDLLLFISKAVCAPMLSSGRYRLMKPRLDPDRPLPYAYNYFDVRFARDRK